MRGLRLPKGYVKRDDCNGCGTGWNAKLVPDKIFFVSIKRACCPHDFGYEIGVTEEDKIGYDLDLLHNMLLIIENVNRWYYPTRLARIVALSYYSAVVEHGDDAFFGE